MSLPEEIQDKPKFSLRGIFSNLFSSRGFRDNIKLTGASYYCNKCGRSINARDRKAKRNHKLPCKKMKVI